MPAMSSAPSTEPPREGRGLFSALFAETAPIDLRILPLHWTSREFGILNIATSIADERPWRVRRGDAIFSGVVKGILGRPKRRPFRERLGRIG